MERTRNTRDRARGRPSGPARQDLKAVILDTAERYFAERGYAATSIRLIADAAGVNAALVHYYFDDKQTLLKHVMERSLQPLAKAIAALRDSDRSSPGAIAGLLLSMAAEHPNIPRLMTREVLLPGGVMRDYFVDNMAPHLGGAIPALLRREQTEGRLAEHLDPAVTAMLVLAVCVFPFIARTLAEPVLGVDFDRQGVETLKHHIDRLFERGLLS